jgi:hypothetical protein
VTQQSLRVVIIRRAALDTPDGINIFIFSLAQALVSKGHEVFIVGTTLRDPERISELYGISRHIRGHGPRPGGFVQPQVHASCRPVVPGGQADDGRSFAPRPHHRQRPATHVICGTQLRRRS